MPSPELEINELVRVARSLFNRGYSFGTAGNLSVRIGDLVYATPTGSSFETVRPEEIAVCTLGGTATAGPKATKELPFHLAAYHARPEACAVVHLHSIFATAVACLRDLDTVNAFPPLTAYFAMRVPALPVVPYLPPGDAGLADEVERLARGTLRCSCAITGASLSARRCRRPALWPKKSSRQRAYTFCSATAARHYPQNKLPNCAGDSHEPIRPEA